MSTISDTRELCDRFLELVLADPDLLDLEFAAVLASWNARPPGAPPKLARRAGWGSRRRRAVLPSGRYQRMTRPHVDRWHRTAARSPPALLIEGVVDSGRSA